MLRCLWTEMDMCPSELGIETNIVCSYDLSCVMVDFEFCFVLFFTFFLYPLTL